MLLLLCEKTICDCCTATIVAVALTVQCEEKGSRIPFRPGLVSLADIAV